jgi:hypothetical protein
LNRGGFVFCCSDDHPSSLGWWCRG